MTKPLAGVAAAVLLATTLAACGETTQMRSDTATDIVTPASASLPPVETSPEIIEIINVSSVPAKAFVEKAGVGNMFEIQAGQIAAEKASRPEVRSYGEHMIRDHTKLGLAMNSKASIAGNEFTVPVRLDAKHQAMIDQLNAASGEQFDLLYVQMMRQSHKDTYELFNAMGDRGSLGNFNELANDNKEMILQHLQEADALAQQLMPTGMPSSS